MVLALCVALGAHPLDQKPPQRHGPLRTACTSQPHTGADPHRQRPPPAPILLHAIIRGLQNGRTRRRVYAHTHDRHPVADPGASGAMKPSTFAGTMKAMTALKMYELG